MSDGLKREIENLRADQWARYWMDKPTGPPSPEAKGCIRLMGLGLAVFLGGFFLYADCSISQQKAKDQAQQLADLEKIEEKSFTFKGNQTDDKADVEKAVVETLKQFPFCRDKPPKVELSKSYDGTPVAEVTAWIKNKDSSGLFSGEFLREAIQTEFQTRLEKLRRTPAKQKAQTVPDQLDTPRIASTSKRGPVRAPSANTEPRVEVDHDDTPTKSVGVSEPTYPVSPKLEKVPDTQAQTVALKAVREVYGEAWTGAATAADKVKLAKRLIQDASETKSLS